MILTIGEILFDIFPAYARLGGAPFNFFFHLKSLGLAAIFTGRIGNDEKGKEILKIFKEKGLGAEYIQIDPVHQTGRVTVNLDEEGIPGFDILKDMAYDYLLYDDTIASALNKDIELIYYGSLVQRTPAGFNTITRILENRGGKTKCFYDINLRPGCYNKRIIERSLANCDILKLSEEELETIKGIFKAGYNGEDFIKYLKNKFSIEWICLTRGEQGSKLYTPERNYSVGIKENKEVVDTVGAGDAYASILAAGYLCKWDPELLLTRATEFAGEVCGIKGAVPDNNAFYKKYLSWIKGRV